MIRLIVRNIKVIEWERGILKYANSVQYMFNNVKGMQTLIKAHQPYLF